jgi:putative NADH-flavin reductase
MKLAIFGASGATGRHLVQQALEAGHFITVLQRSADSLRVEHARLRRVVGALDDPAAVQSVVEGVDVVISVLGARKGGAQTVCADGIGSILPAMQRAGVRRLVALSAYGASETRNASWFIRFVRAVISAKMRDKDEMEKLVRASAVDWTLVRPPALTNGKAGGSYRSGTALRPGVTGRLSRADLAAFMLNEAESGNYLRLAPIVSV